MGTLGTVGIADKGNYDPATTYVLGNSVYYGGSTWVAKKNNLTGITPEEGENWKYLARGFGSDSLSQIEATDTSGVLGTSGETVVSQALIDAIADKVMTKLIPYTNIVDNFLATDPNTVLSGPMGKALKDQLDTTNSNLALKANTTDVTTSLNLKLNKDATSIEWLDLIRRSGLYTVVNKAYTPDNTQEFIFQAYAPLQDSWVVWLTAYQLYADHVYIARMVSTNGTTYTVGAWNQLF